MKYSVFIIPFIFLFLFNIQAAPMPQKKIDKINIAIKEAMGNYYNYLALEVTQAEQSLLTGLISEIGIGTKIFSIHQFSLGLRFDRDTTFLFLDYKEVGHFIPMYDYLNYFIPTESLIDLSNNYYFLQPLDFHHEFEFKSNIIIVKAYQITLTNYLNEIIKGDTMNIVEFKKLLSQFKYLDTED